MLKIFAIVALASFALAGCVTDPNSQVGTQMIQAQQMAERTVTTICDNEPGAYLAFQAFAAVHPVKAKTAAKVTAAHAAIAGVCTDLNQGRSINFLTASIAAANAYDAIKAATGNRA